MAKPKKKDEVEWKRFEKGVARFEIMFRDGESKIKYNDQVKDKYGESRQVDATVLTTKDGVTDLTIIECRRRKAMSDKRWVEEVWGKMDSVDAAHAILVSNKALS